MCVAIALTSPGYAAAAGTSSWSARGGSSIEVESPLPGWVHKDGKYFSYWLPDKDWQAVETAQALDITSPTGLYAVSQGWAPLAMPTTTQEVFQAIVDGHANDMKKWKVLKVSPVTQTSLGTRQVVEFTAMHRYPLQGWRPIRGIAIADALDSGFAYGLDATLMYAPTASWAKQRSTLDRIRTNITVLHGLTSPEE